MSTNNERYCTIADLQDIIPEIGAFDRKRKLGGWELTASAKVYLCGDSGVVAQLFRDGENLGDPESSLVDVQAGVDGDWIYVAQTDQTYILSTLEPDAEHLMEAGTDWEDAYLKAIAKATAMIRSFVRRPIIKRPGAAQDVGLRDYDECIIQATAILSCTYLVEEEDSELHDRLQMRVFGTETDPKGLAVQIREGEFRLWNEAGPETAKGDYTEISINSSTTGGIRDIRGKARVSYDRVKVIIVTGGTFTDGTASAVTYSVYIADSTGAKMSQVVTASTITGTYQALAHGLEIMFSAGVYVADDEWEVEVNGQETETDRRTAPISRF